MKKKIGEIKGVELNAKQMRDLKGGAMYCGGTCRTADGAGKCTKSGSSCDCIMINGGGLVFSC